MLKNDYCCEQAWNYVGWAMQHTGEWLSFIWMSEDGIKGDIVFVKYCPFCGAKLEYKEEDSATNNNR